MVTGKDEFRKRQRSLTFSEKIKVLEQLRERELVIAKAREKLRSERARKT